MFIYARLYIFWDLRYTTVLVSKTLILPDFFHSISYSSYFFPFIGVYSSIFVWLFRDFFFLCQNHLWHFFYRILLWFFIITYSTSTGWNTSACRNNFAEIQYSDPTPHAGCNVIQSGVVLTSAEFSRIFMDIAPCHLAQSPYVLRTVYLWEKKILNAKPF